MFQAKASGQKNRERNCTVTNNHNECLNLLYYCTEFHNGEHACTIDIRVLATCMRALAQNAAAPPIVALLSCDPFPAYSTALVFRGECRRL